MCGCEGGGRYHRRLWWPHSRLHHVMATCEHQCKISVINRNRILNSSSEIVARFDIPEVSRTLLALPNAPDVQCML